MSSQEDRIEVQLISVWEESNREIKTKANVLLENGEIVDIEVVRADELDFEPINFNGDYVRYKGSYYPVARERTTGKMYVKLGDVSENGSQK